jgi:hypothetical protein
MVNLKNHCGFFPFRIAALVVMLVANLPVFGQGRIKFEKTRHDFGEVKEENGLVGIVFEFTNEGSKPLKVLSAKASCGCTTPVFSRDSILAGEKGKIKVEYNPMGRPGIFNKDILVETNGSPEFVTLTIQGKVTPRPKGPIDFYPFEEGAIRFRTNHLTYGSIFVGDTVTQSTILYNQGKKAVQFSKSGSKVPGHLKPKMTKTTLAPGDTLTLWVTYIASLKKDWGFAFDNIYLSTNDPDRPMKRLNISAEIHEKFNPAEKANAPNLSLTKTLIDLGEVKEGDMPIAAFEFKNTGKSPLMVRKLSAACSCIEVTSNKVLQPGESGEIKLRFNSRGRIGEFEKDAELICNDPNQAVTSLQIKGTVVREGAAEGN